MQMPLAKKIIDLIFTETPKNEEIKLGFFGGEPLLRFDLLRSVMDEIRRHPSFDDYQVDFTIVSNGTVLTDRMVDFFKAQNIYYCISCDGPPEIHDRTRRFRDGRGSGRIVEKTLRKAKREYPDVFVNAVYNPGSLRMLPQTVDYFSSLGICEIYLNADYSASWSADDIAALPEVYKDLGNFYIDRFSEDRPLFVSIINNKIISILSGGYKPHERCRMGTHEYAFTPSGLIYPCERLIGSDDGTHAIGSLQKDFHLVTCMRCPKNTSASNPECRDCGIRDYCMNWCGCSNYFSTGRYDAAGPFLCASERFGYQTAFEVFQRLNDQFGMNVMHHFARRDRF